MDGSANPALPGRQSALWNLGFRPFFLLAGMFSVASILAWIAQQSGLSGSYRYAASPLWHAHEMIFGYAFAVVAGFLLTAVRNWTNQPTPSGRPLMLLALLWGLGRVLAASPWFAYGPLADAVFALAVAAAIARPLLRSGNRRNYFFIAVLCGFSAANLLFYLAARGLLTFLAPDQGIRTGLDLLLFLMAVLGGRVIPMFTASGVPGSLPRRKALIERAALGSVLALLLLDLLPWPQLSAAAAAAAALANLARLTLWQPWRTWRTPLVWILHASYAWIVIYLALQAAALTGLIPPSPARHALTVGAIGGLTLGMMTRVARGHTGRELRAGPSEVLAYLLVECAAGVRVFLPLLLPQAYFAAILVSGCLWAGAFAAFVGGFFPILTRPRADGRPG
ncbi:MAG: NnrS family protein [Betaproteobacteria bacterium]|nr:NnrS family protein [Betaproteobacteria bacterium]